MERFAGTVKAFAAVDCGAMADWIRGIPFSDWDQQHPTQPGQLKPAMMTNPAWYGFGTQAEPVVAQLMAHFPGCTATQRMLSVVMPGDNIPPHVDEQPLAWITRVHVPLVADGEAKFMVGDIDHHLVPGTAYLVNTLAVHGVANTGATPRIHFMFDVRRG